MLSTLARRFNRDVQAPVRVEFADAFLYQVFSPGAEYDSSGFFWPRRKKKLDASVENQEKVFVEPLLSGKFVKANCNQGYVGNLKNSKFHDTAQPFSHWTWTVTDGELLVCDLQGVQRKKSWQFTDPAIHDAAGKQRFGCTDLGPRGINFFFQTHKCNSICRDMKKPIAVIDIALPASVSNVGSTTFSWELVQVSSEVHSQQDFADILDQAHSGTCYAQAAATILRHAERRIVGRTPEMHHVIAKRIVERFGTKGGSVAHVLDVECPPKRLRWRKVHAQHAASCLEIGRAVLCAFHLTDEQWRSFSEFFRASPSGTLSELPNAQKDVLFGHGCVLIGQEQDIWKAKNSWGDDFADGGYFRISKTLLTQLEAQFYDIYFLEQDLTKEDLEAYNAFCRRSSLRTADA